MDKIGICGFGFVGKAVYMSIKDKDNVVIYDKYTKSTDFYDLIKCKVIFVCVPTPTKKGKQDASIIKSVLSELQSYSYRGVVIIKSTVLPEHLEKEYGLNIVYNPEFLKQNDAVDDFYKQEDMILGGDFEYTAKVEEVFSTYFDFYHPIQTYIHTDIRTAIQVKYIHNIYHAYKALFWNYVLDVTGDHNKIYTLYRSVASGGMDMNRVAQDGERGFGGACFPKDLVAFHDSFPHELTRSMIEQNEKYRPLDMGEVLS